MIADRTTGHSWTIRFSKSFRRDVRRLKKAGADVRKLQSVIDVLASDKPLDSRFRDHALTGTLSGFHDCHIAPDWVLIYQRVEKERMLYLVRTGPHTRLFAE